MKNKFIFLENRALLRSLHNATFRLKANLKIKPNSKLLQHIEKIFLISDLIKQEADKKKVRLFFCHQSSLIM